MVTRCWNCGSPFVKESGKHEKCPICKLYKCPRCGRCAPHCNYDQLNFEYNKWHKRNCSVCIHAYQCRYMNKAKDKRLMFQKINQGILKTFCLQFKRKI